MNNITNINNKPLKCVITNNKNAIKYFSTNYGTGKEAYAGTLIVLEYPADSSSDYKHNGNYREIYLNEKFLAGGYGFATDTYLKVLEEIAQSYKETIDQINKTETDNVLQIYKDKLDREGENANASKVYFEYNDSQNIHRLYIKDIIELLSKVPQYKDLEITSISMAGKYKDYDGSTKDLGGKNYNSESIEYYDIDSFTLPINAKLEYISAKITYNYNHSGGISSFNVFYYLSPDSDQLSSSYYTNTVEDRTTGNLAFGLRFYDSNPFIIKEDNKVIEKIDLHILSTPQEKYQSIQLTNSSNSNIIYTANIIPEHDETIEFPIIKGSYYLTYSTYSGSSSVYDFNFTETFTTKEYVKITTNNNNKNEFTYIKLNNSSISKIAIILPCKFTIRQAYLVNGSDEISITNFLNYYNYENNEIIQNNLKSNLYYIYVSGNGFDRNYTLKLDIVENENITYDDMNIDSNNIYACNNLQHVLNSDEVHKYWINDNNIENVSTTGLDVIFNYDKL